MKIICLSFLLVISLWAVSVASADLATSKITNKKILLGAKLLLTGLLAQLFVTYFGYQRVYQVFLRWEFYPLFIQHVFLSALAGIILWYAEIWPAGDAKFFILISAALPVAYPEINNFPHKLFLTLLINIFVMASLFAVGGYITSGLNSVSPADSLDTLWADIKQRFSALFLGKDRLRNLIFPFNLLFVFLMRQVFARELRGAVGSFFLSVDIMYLFLFLLWDKVGVVFQDRRWMGFMLVCYLLYFIVGHFYFYDHLAGMVVIAMADVFKFGLLLFFGRFILSFLMEKKDVVGVTERELVPGMVLSSASSAGLKANPVFDGAFDDRFRDGLDETQVALLREWLKKLPGGNAKVEIIRGRPFAVWISAGAALTLLLNKNLAHFFK